MSTRPEPTHDDATTTRTTTPTDFSTATTNARRAIGDALEPRDDDDRSWTDRCTRQFATADASRMRNLADDQNHAMHDGV